MQRSTSVTRMQLARRPKKVTGCSSMGRRALRVGSSDDGTGGGSLGTVIVATKG
jgi:hypothetical protein